MDFGSVCVTEKGPVWISQIPISSPDRLKFPDSIDFYPEPEMVPLFVGV